MSSSSSSKPAFDDDEPVVFEAFRPHKNPYDLNNRIMLTAIISLSLVVLLVIALHIYARYALRRQARRQAIMRRLGILAYADTDAGREPPSRSGLDPLVIASLPVFVFKQTENQDHSSATAAAVECAVCLSGLEDGETARILPNCKHTFHSECIDKWFSSHSTCPICRTEAQPRLQPEPRESPAAPTPTAPVIEPISNSGNGGSSSRLSSFRRILSRERSSRRIQPCGRENRENIEDLEGQ